MTDRDTSLLWSTEHCKASAFATSKAKATTSVSSHLDVATVTVEEEDREWIQVPTTAYVRMIEVRKAYRKMREDRKKCDDRKT